MENDLVTVSTYPTMVEAELAKNILGAAGIEAFIHAPHANALYPGVLGEVMLQVREEDLKKAQQALEQGTLLDEEGDT